MNITVESPLNTATRFITAPMTISAKAAQAIRGVASRDLSSVDEQKYRTAISKKMIQNASIVQPVRREVHVEVLGADQVHRLPAREHHQIASTPPISSMTTAATALALISVSAELWNCRPGARAGAEQML